MKGISHSRRLVGVLGAGSFFVALALLACSSPEPFDGTELSSRSPAVTFEFQNQFGQPVSLSDHIGKVVLITFLYTSCPDICPIVAGHLRDTHLMLGDDAQEVALVAVSVDPARDSVQAAFAYSEKWRMTHKWDFLVGSEEELSPIWSAYFLDPVVEDRPSEAGTQAQEQGDHHGGGAVDLKQEIESEYLVAHSAPVFLIDRQGLMRVLFTLPFDPKALVHDVRLLLK